MPRRWASTVALAGLLLAVAGCAAHNPPPPPPGPPTPGPVTSPPPAPLPPAANGDNVSACAQGNCEVRVSGPVSIPLDPRFGLANLRVVSITSDGKVVIATDVPGGGRVQGNGGCSFSAVDAQGTTPASVTAQCGTGGRVTFFPAISLGVAEISQNVAIIRLLPL